MKTHWKKTIDKDWIGTYILPEGNPIVVTLVSIRIEDVKVRGELGSHRVAYFAKNPYFDKPMLLNSVKNLKRLEKLIGTPYIEDWYTLNLRVTLQQEMDKSIGGGKDWALRIAPDAPEKPKLEFGTTKFNDALKAVADGNTTVEAIQKHYSIQSKELKLLKDAIQNKG